MKNRKQLVSFVALILLLCIESSVLVLAIEILATGSFKYGLWWMLTHKKVFILSVFILDVLAAFILSITNRIWIGNSIFIIVFMIFGYATAQKLKFRQEPIFPNDLSFVNQAGSILKMVNLWGVIAVIVFSLLIVMLNYLIFRSVQAKYKFSLTRWVRVLGVGMALLLVFSFFRLNHPNSLSQRAFAKFNNNAFFWDPITAINSTGPVLTFINNLDYSVMNQPKSYSKAKMAKVEKKYEKVAESYNRTRQNTNINKQTLVYILSESFSDPTRVPNLTVNMDPIKNIRKIKQKTTSGLMLSSGYGGGTANMEYMVDTSLNLNFFAPTLSVPFTQLVPTQSKAYAITDLFKNKNAIHTNTGSFYRRQEVYKKFGFETFRSATSTGKEKLKYAKKIQKSDLIGDDQAYKDTLWQIEQHKSGQFISTVTMQNHLPYTDKYNSYDYKVKGSATNGNQNEVEHYIQGIHLTDKSTAKFIQAVDKLDKPVTIMFYGDHLAGIYPGNDMHQYNLPMHETDFFIYSNKFARRHGYGTQKVKTDSNIVGANTLTALALKQMKQKVTPYHAMITKIQEELPAMAQDSQGSPDGLWVNQKNQQVHSDAFSKSQQQVFDDYRLIQYDLTAGKHYLSKDFMTKIAK